MNSAAILLAVMVSAASNMPELRSKCLRCDFKPHRQRIFVGEAIYAGGLVITYLCPESPLAKARVEPGDILVGIESYAITDAGDLQYALSHGGTRLKFYVVRDGETLFGFIPNPRQRTPANDWNEFQKYGWSRLRLFGRR